MLKYNKKFRTTPFKIAPIFLTVTLSLTSVSAMAHNPITSTLIISEADDGKFRVQLEGALTGVEAQINQVYSSQAYQTAEQFRSLASEHFVDSLTLSINDIPITVVNPRVQLGHGTRFTAELQKVPTPVRSIDLSNTFFKDLHGNSMRVVLLSDQLPRKTYVLNDANRHHMSLTFKNGQWQ